MKKIIFALVLAAILVAPAHAAIKVAVSDITPQPVNVGSDFTLGVDYTNTGSDYLYNVPASVDLRYPFKLKTSTENFTGGFDLCGLCSRNNNYFISVDSSSSSGTYPIFIRTGSDSVTTINVIVQGKPNVVLFPEPVTNATPTGEFLLNVDAANIGSGTAKQVKIISKATNFVSIGPSVAVVDSIDANTSKRVVFHMAPDENLIAGAYNIPFELNYLDENGAVVNSTQNIGVRIVNYGELNVQSIKVAATSGAPTAGQPLTVIIRLENIGRGDANAVQAQITCDGVTARSFLGQLKRDEDAPAVFDITLPNGGKHQCTMTAKYMDDLGDHVFTSDFDVTVKNPDLPFGLILIVIIIGGVYFYRKRRHHKK